MLWPKGLKSGAIIAFVMLVATRILWIMRSKSVSIFRLQESEHLRSQGSVGKGGCRLDVIFGVIFGTKNEQLF